MATIPELKNQYESLDNRVDIRQDSAIDAECLMAFQYEYPGQETEVVIDTDEFTAVCPWTGLPDYGTLTITYVPGDSCIELKSLKYYLLSFRDVGIVQEHAANRILQDFGGLLQSPSHENRPGLQGPRRHPHRSLGRVPGSGEIVPDHLTAAKATWRSAH